MIERAVPVKKEPATPAREPSSSDRSRPPGNGRFTAARLSIPLLLDGDLSDWPSRWTPAQAIIQGAEHRIGDADLSAEFQTLWSPQGLYLAVRVQDDIYRPGPAGTDMWQGDGLEIFFDRLLADDYDSTDVDADDYQLGVSFGPDFGEVRGYRWYPYNLEAAFALEGRAVATGSGYAVELLIPWSLRRWTAQR